MILSNTEYINCIDSIDTRNYYYKSGIDVKPQIVFSLIYHCDKLLSIKLDAMKKLATYCTLNRQKETDEVAIQANKYCERMMRFIEDFKLRNDNELYKVSFKEDGDESSNLFPLFESAIKYITEYDRRIEYIEINKIKMDPDDTDALIGTVYLDSDSKEIKDIWIDSSLYSDYECDALFENNDPIEERYYMIPSPFEVGDIVKIVGNRLADKNFVLFVSDRNNLPKPSILVDGLQCAYDECGLSLDLYDKETGEIMYYDIGCVSPFNIEYDNSFSEYDHFGSPENNAIVQYRDLLKGKEKAPYAIESILRNYAIIHHIPNSMSF